MTRWARGGPANKKKPNEATPWSKMVNSEKNGASEKERRTHKKYKTVPNKLTVQRSAKPDDLIQFPKQSTSKSSAEIGGLAAELEKIKAEVEKLSDEDEKAEFQDVIKKEARREKRRIKRIEKRDIEKVCFGCRETGHDMASCPKAASKGPMDVCFKCGSTEHAINKCKVRLPPGEFPFAKCFICGEMGHLSKQCRDNPRGLYPNGGCCKMCGSVEHYKKDCPDLQKKQGVPEIRLPRSTAGFGIEYQPNFDEELKPPPFKKKKPKIVVF